MLALLEEGYDRLRCVLLDGSGSWNAFGPRITQDMMVQAVDAMVAKNRTVAGWEGKVSLCDLGYCSVGIDEGWEVIDTPCSEIVVTG
jgi:hypothetical protein